MGKKRKEKIKGVEVLRCFEIGRRKGAIGLALNYLSYMLSASLKALFLKIDFDIIFLYQLSPVTMALPGIIMKKRSRKPLYLYCCDIWPESKKIESMIYKKEDKYELETPTLDIMSKSIPISGGGYFRLFPLWLMKHFMKKHWEKEDNFIFYIHPFEVIGETLENGKKMGKKNYFRFQVERPALQKKLFKYIKWLKKQDVEFVKFEDYIDREGIAI